MSVPAGASNPIGDGLVRAQKMDVIARLAPGIAHDLNNQLAAIAGIAELILDDAEPGSDLQRDADLIVTEIDRTRGLIQTLLNFARARPSERHPTNLRPLVESVLALSSYRLLTAHVSTHLQVADGLPTVPIDRSKMQLALLTLLLVRIDALEDTSQPVRLELRVEWAGDEHTALALSVTSDAERPFVADAGAGAAIAAQIIAEHGGRLIENDPDVGPESGFRIELPLASEPVATEPRASEPLAPELAATEPAATKAAPTDREAGEPASDTAALVMDSGSGRADLGAEPTAGELERAGAILVLDDEPSIRALLEKALRSFGQEVVLAGDGRRAIDILRRQPVAAIMCDQRMAGMTGAEFYAEAVALRPELRDAFVLMSGDVLDPVLRTFADERGVRLLSKPFDLGTIGQLVRDLRGH